MAEERDNSVTIRFSDPKVWVLIAAAMGGQFAVSKLSLGVVENQQQQVADTTTRSAEKWTAVEAAIRDLKASQDRSVLDTAQFQGEVRYRLDQLERRQRESDDSKKGTR